MLKRSRFYVGVSLTVQAISFFFMFIALIAKKKSVAMAFLTVAAMEGCAGAYLLYQSREEEKALERELDYPMYPEYEDESNEIPVDDEACEEDFQ